MKKLLLFFLLNSTIVFCNTNVAKWTILVYMNADNDLEGDGIDDFIEMAEVINSDQINIVVQFDRIAGYSDRFGDWTGTARFHVKNGSTPTVEEALLDPDEKVSMVPKEKNMGDPEILKDFIRWGKETFPAEHYILVIWGHGAGYRVLNLNSIEQSLAALYKKDFLDQKKSYENFYQYTNLHWDSSYKDLQTAEFALKIDLNEVSKEMPALPEALKISKNSEKDWTLFSTQFAQYFTSSLPTLTQDQLKKANKIESLIGELVVNDFEQQNLEKKKELSNTYKENEDLQEFNFKTLNVDPVRSVSSDETSGDVLYNKELHDILAKDEVDIIVFDSCLMNMLETAYTLQTKCEFIIGSQELVPASGLNYKDWLIKLVENPDLNARFVSRFIIESYKNSYSLRRDLVTMSCLQTQTVNTLVNQVDNLSLILLANYKKEEKNINNARTMCLKYAINYPNIQSIDLYLFAFHLDRFSQNSQIKDSCKRIMSAIGVTVVENFANGQEFFPLDKPSYGSQGLAIYFPLRNKYFDKAYSDKNNKYPIQFVQDTNWDSFLEVYYRNLTN